MKKNEIRGLLIVAGTNANKLAAVIGVSKQAIYQVVNGDRATPHIRAAIAKTINLPQSDIWPDRTEGNT